MDIKQLNKNAEINIDHSKNLILYLRSADMLFKQANIYYLELDYKRAYVLYLKYSNLVISKIKLHPQYSIQNLQNSIQKLRSNAIIAMDRIEIIKPILLKQHQDEINKQNDLKESIKKEKELKQKQFEFEQEQKILKEQHEILTRMNEININTKTDDWWKSHDVNNNSNPLDHIAPVNNQTQIDYSTKSTPLYQTTNTNTTSLYQTNDTTIHQTDISNSLLPPPIPAKPSNIHQYLNENTTISESHVTSPPIPDKPNLFIPNPNDANTNNLYTNITTDNPPPIPPKPDLYQSPAGGPFRKVVLPQSLIPKFLSISAKNTRNNLETCGILCGKLKRNMLFITTLLIPPQTATSDTVSTTDEMAVFNYQDQNELMTFGWIHSHPTQSCFLSSVDVHTHCSYQMMLPEAIAIVVAPSKSPNMGIFRLTDPPGIDIVSSCRHPQPFHPHEREDEIYVDVEEDVVVDESDCALVDLR